MGAEKTCCVKTCGLDTEILHKFPNPENDIDRFRTWISNIGGDISSLNNTFIYKYRRVCHLHFEPAYYTRSKMLSCNAIPTLCLTGPESAQIQVITPSIQHEEISPLSQPSSSMAHSTSVIQPTEETPLSEILALLDDAAKSGPLEKNTHKDVTHKWNEIISKGLPKEDMEKLITEYSVQANCKLFTPVLNAETKAALEETYIKRDNLLMANQKLIGVALSALSQAVNVMFSNNDVATEVLKPITDACRILYQCHNSGTELRRDFVKSAIDTRLHGGLIESRDDRYLFGKDLSERLQSNVQESGVLKRNMNKFISKSNSGNVLDSRDQDLEEMNGARTGGLNGIKPDDGGPSPRKRHPLRHTTPYPLPLRRTKQRK